LRTTHTTTFSRWDRPSCTRPAVIAEVSVGTFYCRHKVKCCWFAIAPLLKSRFFSITRNASSGDSRSNAALGLIVRFKLTDTECCLSRIASLKCLFALIQAGIMVALWRQSRKMDKKFSGQLVHCHVTYVTEQCKCHLILYVPGSFILARVTGQSIARLQLLLTGLYTGFEFTFNALWDATPLLQENLIWIKFFKYLIADQLVMEVGGQGWKRTHTILICWKSGQNPWKSRQTPWKIQSGQKWCPALFDFKHWPPTFARKSHEDLF